METSTTEEFTEREMDNQNTNRNETCIVPTCMELVTESGNGLSETEAKVQQIQQVQEEEEAECDDQENENEHETSQMSIPSVVITAPDDDNDNEDMSDESSHMVKASMDEINVVETKSDEQVEEKLLEPNSGVDTCTTSDDEFEVICRCSSTPVSTTSESQVAGQSPKCEVEENGCRKYEEGKLRKDDEKDEKTYVAQSQGVVYVQPQYLAPPAQNEELRAHMPPEYANAQAAANYDVTSFAQQAPVYMASGTIAYVNGQQPAVTYTSYQPDGVCQQAALANGYNASFVPRPDQQFTEEQQAAGAQNAGDVSIPFQPSSEMYNFVYPSIYVSNAGLISVLLRQDMSVEMTVDRTIRVVSHQHMMAVATDSRGMSACLYHPTLKVIQQGTTTDIATDRVRVHMGHDEVAFAVGNKSYRFDTYDVQPVSQVKFSDVSKDQSVNLLFSSEGYGENLVPQCLEVASKAEYANLPKGGVIVRINGVKVTQNGAGDVTVVTGAKFIRLSPSFGMTRLGNRFIDIEIERNWSCRVSRGPHCFLAGERRVIISNSKLEVDINEHGRFKVSHLQPRRPATPQQCLRPEQLARRVNSVTCNTSPSTRPPIARTPPPPRRRSAPVGVSR